MLSANESVKAAYAETKRSEYEAKDAVDMHLFQARRMYKESFIARAELLHAQVAQAQADRELKSSRHDLEIAHTALANILSSDKPVTPTTPLFLVSIHKPVDDFVRQARDTHPALDQGSRNAHPKYMGDLRCFASYPNGRILSTGPSGMDLVVGTILSLPGPGLVLCKVSKNSFS